MTVTSPPARGDGAGSRRAPLARRRRAPVALPAGAHAGQEDGQGDDLLAGALATTRTSTRRRSAATCRASASSASAASATTSTRSSRRSARSCAPPASTTSRCSAPATSARRSPRSDIFADHGFRVVAIFDADPAKVGEQVGAAARCAPSTTCAQVVEDEDIVVGVLAVPDRRGPGARRRARRRRREDHLQLLRGAAAGAAGGDGPHLQPRRRPALRALLLPDLSRASMPDRPRARRGGLRGLDRLHRRARGGVRAPRPRRRSTSSPRFEELRDAARGDDPVLRDVDRRRADLLGDRDPLRPRRGPRTTRSARQRELRRRLFALAAARGVALGATGTHPWADYREQPSSTPSTTAASSTGCSTSPGATTPSRCTSTSASAAPTARSASATACARCCRCCWRSRANSPYLDGARLRACTRRARRCSRRASRAAASPTPSARWAAYRDYLDFLVAHELDRRVHAGLVVGAPALHASAPSRCGSATRSRTAARVRGAGRR